MAYLFDDASTEGFQYTSGSMPTDFPFTFSGWSRPDDAANTGNIVSIGDSSVSDNYTNCVLHASNFLRNFLSVGGSGGSTDTLNSWTVNQWNHACATFERPISDVDVNNTLNGNTGSAGSASYADLGTLSVDSIWAGRLFDTTPGNYMSGYLAEVAVWDVVLTADEKAALAAGFSPLFIRPASLVFYAPLWNSNKDMLNPGRSITTAGTPVSSPSVHPSMIYPAWANIAVPSGAVVANKVTPLVNGGLVNAGLTGGRLIG